MTTDERWLATLWPHIRTHLPTPPAVVVDVGCGPLGGFVPAAAACGYDAWGVDPEAPHGPSFLQVALEAAALPDHVDAMIACSSLHHVDDPGAALDALVAAMAPAGVAVVVEWDWQRFDEASARWAFERLGPAEEREEDGHGAGDWLRHRREGWLESGRDWEAYLHGYATSHGMHTAATILAELDRRLERSLCSYGPYLFSELAETTEEDEQQAIDAGRVRAMRIDYVGRPR